ncbi:MAG: TlpA family protein disulfide reductase [Bacteroidales bacterium]|nr:TlpA family protein disulfide reductase [Bacteroidales bacterium]
MEKKLSSILIVLCVLSCSLTSAQSLPSVKLSDVSGKQVTTSSLIDHKTPFVVSLWLTTCKPCLKELEVLSDEACDWDAGFPLRIYAVSLDDSRSLQRAVAMSQGQGWEGIVPLFDSNGYLRRALNVSVVPQVFVYDKEGTQVYTHIGYHPGDESTLLSELRKAAGK